jgi:undecaprenyl pyrophosphate phosphatase UppP
VTIFKSFVHGLIQGLTKFIHVVAVGFRTVVLVGYLSIRWLLRFVSRRPLYVFAAYCVAASLAVLFYTYVIL